MQCTTCIHLQHMNNEVNRYRRASCATLAIAPCDESCLTWMSYVPHIIETCPMSMSHFPHVNASCAAYEEVVCHVQTTRHVRSCVMFVIAPCIHTPTQICNAAFRYRRECACNSAHVRERVGECGCVCTVYVLCRRDNSRTQEIQQCPKLKGTPRKPGEAAADVTLTLQAAWYVYKHICIQTYV